MAWKIIQIAIYPYHTSLITSGHQKDINLALASEVMRLIKEVGKTIDEHMIDTKVQKPDSKPSNVFKIEQAEEVPEDDEAKRKRKYAPIYVSEYKEHCGHFHKLIDTL